MFLINFYNFWKWLGKSYILWLGKSINGGCCEKIGEM